MQTLRGSPEGLEQLQRARERIAVERGWAIESEQWLDEASQFLPLVKAGKNLAPGTVSIGTWKRFLRGKAVKAHNFKAFCLVLGVNWEKVAELSEVQTKELKGFTLPEKIAPVRNWVGRSQELETLKSQLFNPHTRAITITAISIVGLAGIGKTTLASQLIRQLHAEKAPFVVAAWESLRSVTGKPPRFESIVDSLLHTLSNGEITQTVTILDDHFKRTERLVKLLKEKSCLVVLDNVETVLKAKQAKRAGYFADHCAEYSWLFQQIAEADHQSKIIFTSRETLAQLQGRGTNSFVLGGLEQDAAVKLLESFNLTAESLEKLPQRLAELAIRYEGHPKALELVAAVIQEEFQGRVDRFLEDRKWLLIRDLENLIDEVINRLSSEEYVCLSQISVYQTSEYSLSHEGITAQMPDVSERDLKESTILALKRRQLLDYNSEHQFYQMHPLVQEKASLLLNPESFYFAHRQAYRYFISIVKPESEWKDFDDIKPLLRIHYHTCQSQDWDEAATAIERMYEFLRQKGYFDLLIDLYSELIPKNWKDGEKLVSNPQAHIDILCNIGHAYNIIRDHETAGNYMEKGLELSRNLRDSKREAKALCFLGINTLGDSDKALPFFQTSLAISLQIKDYKIVYKSLEHLGLIYQILGDYQAATDFFNRSLNIAQEFGFQEEESIALGNLADVYTRHGDYKLANESYQKYLEYARNTGNLRCQTNALFGLSFNCNCMGDYASALEFAQECLKFSRLLGDRKYESWAFNNIGIAYRGLGEYQKSITALRGYLKITREICYKMGNRAEEVVALLELAKSSSRINTISQETIQSYLDQAEEICVEFQLELLREVQQIKNELLRDNSLSL